MPTIRLADGLSLHCAVDDYLWPWEAPVPVLMMHGFARNANFWNRWVPPIAESLPRGRLERFAGYGHGVNLLQPERCARGALEFWRTAEEVQR